MFKKVGVADTEELLLVDVKLAIVVDPVVVDPVVVGPVVVGPVVELFDEVEAAAAVPPDPSRVLAAAILPPTPPPIAPAMTIRAATRAIKNVLRRKPHIVFSESGDLFKLWLIEPSTAERGSQGTLPFGLIAEYCVTSLRIFGAPSKTTGYLSRSSCSRCLYWASRCVRACGEVSMKTSGRFSSGG